MVNLMYTLLIQYTLCIIAMGCVLFGATKVSHILTLVTFPLTCLIILYFGMMSLGRPIPASMLVGRPLNIMSVLYQENIAIYIIGTTSDGSEPVMVSLPWSEKEAKDVSDAMEEFGSDNVKVTIGGMGEDVKVEAQHAVETKQEEEQ